MILKVISYTLIIASILSSRVNINLDGSDQNENSRINIDLGDSDPRIGGPVQNENSVVYINLAESNPGIDGPIQNENSRLNIDLGESQPIIDIPSGDYRPPIIGIIEPELGNQENNQAIMIDKELTQNFGLTDEEEEIKKLENIVSEKRLCQEVDEKVVQIFKKKYGDAEDQDAVQHKTKLELEKQAVDQNKGIFIPKDYIEPQKIFAGGIAEVIPDMITIEGKKYTSKRIKATDEQFAKNIFWAKKLSALQEIIFLSSVKNDPRFLQLKWCIFYNDSTKKSTEYYLFEDTLTCEVGAPAKQQSKSEKLQMEVAQTFMDKPPLEKLNVIFELADQLKTTHSKNKVHSDIKPENMMFTDKTASHARLIDFGSVRDLGQPIVGYTELYIDKATKKNFVANFKQDIHAFALSLVHILTGIDSRMDARKNALAIEKDQNIFDPLATLNEMKKLTIQRINEYAKKNEWVVKANSPNNFVDLIEKMLSEKSDEGFNLMCDVCERLTAIIKAVELNHLI